MPELPARPSAEHLRKQAKRLARERTVRLSEAQRLLANEYGFRTWPLMMRHVAADRDDVVDAVPPLVAAVRARDLDAVREALANGANPRVLFEGETPLHTAARAASVAVVEALIEGGALEWVKDRAGRTALDVARRGSAADRAAIVALLDCDTISDPSFAAAVAAVQAGDVIRLGQLLDAEPRLLTDRIIHPEVYRKRKRRGYFTDPKLFWFVANNPTLARRMPANIADIARVMIERGVERSDLDYTLGLVMTSSVAREQGHQRALMRVLLAAGATATRETILSTAAHWEVDALRAILEAGQPMDALLAAAFGDVASLRSLLPATNARDVTLAFGLAVINRHVEAASLALEAGAEVNAFLPVHSHSTALHQAAGDNNVPMIEMLLRAGANPDIHDTLWDGTPLGWAMHVGNAAAQTALCGASADSRAAITVTPVRSDAEYQQLLELLLEYERSLPADLRHGLEPTPESARRDYDRPNAAFLAVVDGAAVGCVALTGLDESTGVIKRLYVSPAYRKHGGARALVAAALDFSRAQGHRRVVLDTDREQLRAAYEFYLSLGFTECEPYGSVGYRCPTFMEVLL